jgi:hypothetical protein
MDDRPTPARAARTFFKELRGESLQRGVITGHSRAKLRRRIQVETFGNLDLLIVNARVRFTGIAQVEPGRPRCPRGVCLQLHCAPERLVTERRTGWRSFVPAAS